MNYEFNKINYVKIIYAIYKCLSCSKTEVIILSPTIKRVNKIVINILKLLSILKQIYKTNGIVIRYTKDSTIISFPFNDSTIEVMCIVDSLRGKRNNNITRY